MSLTVPRKESGLANQRERIYQHLVNPGQFLTLTIQFSKKSCQTKTQGHTVLVGKRHLEKCSSVETNLHSLSLRWMAVAAHILSQFLSFTASPIDSHFKPVLTSILSGDSVGVGECQVLVDSKPKEERTKEKGEGIKKDVAQRRLSCCPKLRTQKFQNAFYKRACFERENSVWMSKVPRCVCDDSGCHVFPLICLHG